LLLPISVAENIAFGRPRASMKEIERAAELAGIADFIHSLPRKFDTLIADGGQNLSGGQRQRLAIARGLLSDASILVLDEPTSALDAFQENGITDTLNALRGERTIIIVSHRLSVVSGCDHIFVLNRGEIVERGTHLELIERSGLYAELQWAQRQ
jgi:ATP-binding cassette subfamily B protein